MSEPHIHGPSFPWPAIEADYVSGLLSPTLICEKYGVNMRQFERERLEGGWVEKRKVSVVETTARALEVAKNDVVRDHARALKITSSTMLLVARALRQRIKDREYEPTVGDLTKLVMLERRLQDPGWDGQGKPATVMVNVNAQQAAVRIEAVILAIQDKQREKPVHEYLYAPLEEDE